ncbi:MAG: NUDIX domain-containing protein [Thermomicrobiales bacterium]
MFCQRCGRPTADRLVDARIRPVCTVCGAVTYLDPKLAVAVVVERDGMLLFGRRAEGSCAAGKWSFPAGFVERGERVEDAAVRETREEVGLEVTLGPLLGLYSASGETVVLAVFTGGSDAGAAVAADDLDAVAWHPPDDPPDLAFPHDTRIIRDWLVRRSGNGGA